MFTLHYVDELHMFPDANQMYQKQKSIWSLDFTLCIFYTYVNPICFEQFVLSKVSSLILCLSKWIGYL